MIRALLRHAATAHESGLARLALRSATGAGRYSSAAQADQAAEGRPDPLPFRLQLQRPASPAAASEVEQEEGQEDEEQLQLQPDPLQHDPLHPGGADSSGDSEPDGLLLDHADADADAEDSGSSEKTGELSMVTKPPAELRSAAQAPSAAAQALQPRSAWSAGGGGSTAELCQRDQGILAAQSHSTGCIEAMGGPCFP